MKNLRTVDQVIDALGGTSVCAEIAGMTPQQVSNARAAGAFPSKSFLVFSAALSRIGKKASPALWGMKMPENAA